MTRRVGIAILTIVLAGCASHRPAPPPLAPSGAPGRPNLEIPPELTIAAPLRQQYVTALSQLQAGDLRNSNRGFSDVLKASPDFYPAEAGLAYIALANRQYRQAAT